MRVGVVQLHSSPKAVEENVKKGIAMFRDAVAKGAQIVAFPELWICGYFLETENFLAATAEVPRLLESFCALSKENGVVTILPVPQKKPDGLYIGLYIIEKNGEVLAEYQKSFLWGREQNYFLHGKREYTPVNTSLGRIGVLICYDIEFPEPARLLALRGAQVIFVPSVWSIPAQNRWTIQLPARALDNTVFVVGINNVGEGACGQSKVISPIGDVLARASAEKEQVLLANLDLSWITQVRENIPYLKEYDPTLTPGGLGSSFQ